MAGFRSYVEGEHGALPRSPLPALFGALDENARRRTLALLRQFFRYHATRSGEWPLNFVDCSLGNLIFAGAYLERGRDFNAAARTLAEMVNSQARLIDVSKGECRTLVGLKADGTLLPREAEIGGKQSAVPILETFFLDEVPDAAAWAAIADGTVEAKLSWLRAREQHVEPSEEARAALAAADVIIYGPGTQHSSLLPSYRIARREILASPAAVKAFIVNLRQDHDIQGLSATDLVDKGLHYLGDPKNARRGITHVLRNAAGDAADAVRIDRPRLAPDGTYKGAAFIEGDFENPVRPTVHSGYAVVSRTLQLAEHGGLVERRDAIDVYIDLVGRSLGRDTLIQEMLEIRWERRFSKLSILLNRADPPTLENLPAHLSIARAERREIFSEIGVLRDWLLEGASEYLVTVTGDGEYRLRDIPLGVRTLDSGNFGALFGSRNQSRLQFRGSLRAAYGEGGILFWLSWLGAFLVTALLGLRLGMIFSDPLSGFRIYRRGRLPPEFQRAMRDRMPTTAVAVTRLLVRSGVEVAEIPVSYRTFTGFTDPRWRFSCGIKNLLGVFR